jgi:pantoate kinase
MDDAARAFVPGHVTAFFTVEEDDDPTRAGSTGAGVALDEGVTVEVAYAEEPAVLLNGERVEMGAVERVLRALSVSARVEAETELPVGAGFGVSGAAALGTALAANDLFELALSTNELVTVAHGAEVQAGTGLGDVVAQARGGIPIRLEPGGPHSGEMDDVPARRRVEYVSFGELATADVIGGDTEALSDAGEVALSEVVREPTPEQVTYAGRRFAREADLLTERVGETVRAVTDAGGDAAMAMLGQTVFAFGEGLSAAGYDPSVARVDPAGARVGTPDDK